MTKEERIKAAEVAYPQYPNDMDQRYSPFRSGDIHCHKKRKAFIKGAKAEAESIRLTRIEIQQLFDNKSDCKTTYLDGDYEADAMSNNRFVELIFALFGKPTPLNQQQR